MVKEKRIKKALTGAILTAGMCCVACAGETLARSELEEAQEDAASGTVTAQTSAGETLAVDTAAEAVSENTETTQEV